MCETDSPFVVESCGTVEVLRVL